MNIPWDKIIDFIINLINSICPSTATPETVLEQLHNPGPFVRIGLRRLVRKEMGLSREAWRRGGDEIMEDIYAEGREALASDAENLFYEAREDLDA